MLASDVRLVRDQASEEDAALLPVIELAGEEGRQLAFVLSCENNCVTRLFSSLLSSYYAVQW